MKKSLRIPLLAAGVACVLAGCNGSGSMLPGTSTPTSGQQSFAAVRASATIYSTRVTFRGNDGRSYSGDAIVLPRNLFPKLPASELPAALRPDRRPNTGSQLTYYMALPGIKGGVPQPLDFEGWVELTSFSISPSDKGGAVLAITKGQDIASPPIMADVFNGQALKGEMPMHAHGSDPELDVVLSDVAGGKAKVVMYFEFPAGNGFHGVSTFTGFDTQYQAGTAPSEEDTLTSTLYVVCVYPVTNGGPPSTKPVCSNSST
jgi:hypothetical protein